jgi:prevent-host-death family protein
MKTVSVRELQKKIKACIDDSQGDRVVITRNGKPAAVLYGVEGSDWEAVVRQMDPEFWKLIEERRKQTGISFEEFEKKLGQSS